MKRFPNVVLATACIPWRASDAFDPDVFADTLRGLLARNLRHIYLFGTAGEGYAVTDSQFREITHCFANIMSAQDCHPMIGLISL